MRVLFRCDATRDRGAGHVVRSVAFAEAARAAGWDCVFCGTVENPLARKLIGDLPLHEAPADDDLPALAATLDVDVVHVDSYEFACRTPFDAVLSSVEDLDYGRRAATLVIDPSPLSEARYRPADGSHRLFRGAKAIPLRRSVVEGQPHTLSDGPLKVLIMLGGTDARNLTAKVTADWLAAGVPSEVHAVSAVDIPGVRTHRPGPDVARLFGEMDLVISASGTTIWELAHLGVPAALVQAVDNQRDNYEFAAAAGFAVGLGERPVEVLRELGNDRQRLSAMSEAGRAIVDGAGSGRVVALWAELVSATGLSARAATLDDASMLYDWRNDAAVRAVSRSTGELGWDSHIGWLRRVLADERRMLLLVQDGTQPVATVRFDAGADGWEVSITLAPAARGKGRSGAILHTAEAFFGGQHPGTTLIAEMLRSNPASLRLFQSAGYGGLRSYTGPEGQHWHRLRKPH